MNRNKELFKNTIIVLFGKICTQLITFILLPVYTHYLSTDNYGIVDLVVTYMSLLAPLISLQLEYAAFRFLIDDRKKKTSPTETITNVLNCLFILIFITCILFFVFTLFVNVKYKIYLIIILIVTMISNMLLQISRGLGDNINYSISSFICGSLNAIISIICIVFIKTNITGIFIAMIISNLICSLFLFAKLKIYRFIDLSTIDKGKVHEMLKYSLPMIPNSICWWIISVSDRTIITMFLGLEYNGIYSVSAKFSGLIVTIYNMFNLSWTESVSLHIDDSDSEEYLSETFNSLIKLFSCGCLMIIVVIPLIFNYIIGQEYLSSYNYIPFLVVGSFFNIIMGMLSAVYIGLKKSKEMAKTSILAAFLNVIINICLIKQIGIWAAVISTVISYFVISIYRLIDVQKYVKIKLKLSNIVFIMMVFFVGITTYLINNLYLNILIFILSVCFSFIYNKSLISSFLNILKNKVGVKKNA